MVSQFYMPFRPALDSNMKTIPGAQAWFTLAGTNTPTPIYDDATLSTAQANPVVANAVGRFPPIYINDAVSYRVRIYDEDGVVGVDSPLEDYDPYIPLEATAAAGSVDADDLADQSGDPGLGADMVGFLQSGTGAVGRTVLDKLRDIVTVKDFGAVGDGATDDSGAFALADAVGATLVIPPGNYFIDAHTTMSSDLLFLGGTVTVDTGVTLTLRGEVTAGTEVIFAGAGSVVGIRDVCPEWFGAVRNGTTDDLAALNKAHTCVQGSKDSRGGRQRIRLLGGTYGVSAVWTVAPTADVNLVVEGTGEIYGGSRITDIAAFASTTTPVMLVDGSTDSIQRITDFELRGFAVVKGAGAATIGLQVGPDSSTKAVIGQGMSEITNIFVNGFANNVKFIHCNGIVIPRLSSWNNGYVGACVPLLITVDGGFTGGLSFGSGCRFVSNSSTTANTRCVRIAALAGLYSAVTGDNSIGGILFDKAELFTGQRALEIYSQDGCMISDIWLSGTQFDAQTTNTIYIEANKTTANTPVVRNVHIDGVYAQQSLGDQITIKATNVGVVQDIHVTNCWLQGAQTSTVITSGVGVTNVHIVDNGVVNNNFHTGSGYAINIAAGVGIQVRGNVLQKEDGASFPDYFLRVAAGVNHYIVRNNISQGNAGTGIILDSGGAVTKSVGDNI